MSNWILTPHLSLATGGLLKSEKTLPHLPSLRPPGEKEIRRQGGGGPNQRGEGWAAKVEMKSIIFQIEWHPDYVRAVCCNVQIAWIPRQGRSDGTLSAMLASEINVFMGSPEFFNLLPQ